MFNIEQFLFCYKNTRNNSQNKTANTKQNLVDL